MSIVLDGTTGITSPAETVTGQFSSGSTFANKNRIINGGMVIDQRNAGASVTLSNSGFVYGVDRWAGVTGLASSSTITIQRVTIGSNGFQYGTRILRGSGSYVSFVTIIQEPESLNTSDLAGQTITVSFWARKGSTSTATTPYVQLISGTGTDQGIAGANAGSWTGWVSVGASVYTPTTTLTQYTASFTVPSNSTELALAFVISSYTGTGSANDYIDITGVQLEKGSVATSFDYRPYGTELSLCQRYYEVSVFNNYGGYFTTANYTGASWQYKVTKRVSPTVTLASGSSTLNNGNSDGVCVFNLINGTAVVFSGSTASAEL